MWLYNHQANIDAQLYQQRMQNAALRAEVERLKMQGVRPDPSWIPPDYKNKEHLMYDPEFVAASANMQDAGYRSGGGGAGWVLLWTLVFIVVIALIWLVLIKQWEVNRY